MRTKDIIITDVLPAYFLYDYAIMGSFALTTKTERFILDEYALDYNGVTETPGHHFSKVLEKVQFPKEKYYHNTLSYPYKSIPCKHPYCYYVDIRHAFAQIAEVVGIDCSHREGRYMAFGNTPLPEIFNDSKIMRALLVSGTGKESSLTEWRNHVITTRKFPNRNHAPMLQRAIYGILHAIGGELAPYSIYQHTDGVIVRHCHIDRVQTILRQHGIQYSIKGEGVTQIYGTGSYRIGEIATRNKTYQRSTNTNIRADTGGWWLKQWDRGKEYRG